MPIVEDLVEILPYLSVLTGLIAGAVKIFFHVVRKLYDAKFLVELLMCIFAGAMFPVGVVLVLSMGETKYLSQIEGRALYIAVAGVALIFLSLYGIYIMLPLGDEKRDKGKKEKLQ